MSGGGDETTSTSFQNRSETDASIRRRGKNIVTPSTTTAKASALSSGADDGSDVKSEAESSATMVLLTPNMKTAILAALNQKTVPESLADALSLYSGHNDINEIPFDTVCKISSFMLSQDKAVAKHPYYLHKLMENSSIQAAAPVKPPTPPELIKRRKKLKAQLANMEYNKMAKNVAPELQRSAANIAPMDVTEGRRVGSLVVNLLITMAACFAFGWFSVASVLVNPNVAFQAIAGVICMVVAAGAELYFLIKISLADPQRQKTEDEKKPKKKKKALKATL